MSQLRLHWSLADICGILLLLAFSCMQICLNRLGSSSCLEVYVKGFVKSSSDLRRCKNPSD